MTIQNLLREYAGKPRGPGIDVVVPQLLLLATAEAIDRKDSMLIQAIDALDWSTGKIEELTAENARLLKLLS